ncbi:MAG TPA: hypothetical protein VNT26_21765, partial [Candidatus Sulfotelmatobacter sp.]|nr:hypothetical protein [Candidatus Sulfotelmatobacter sp.]
SFLIILRGEGADSNGDDYLAYRSERVVTNDASIYYYDGMGPGTAAWVKTPAKHIEDTWQHHRLVVDTLARKLAIYIDDMATPVVENADLARPDSAVPVALRIQHEGNTADDGYFAIDDISLTVEEAFDLTTTYKDGFENYTARTDFADDANPRGPWITVESDGNGSGKTPAPGKVQVVDASVTAPHSGSKCLKLEAGQRAGASLAWGVPPLSDVQITWWAKVPASLAGGQYTYLRMSLYGAENGATILNDASASLAGDNALLGYGGRDATIGDATSLTYYINGAWADTTLDYTPDTWEEYRLTTHTSQGRYTIIKNPSSANPEIIADRAPMVGTATNWSPVFMAAWSSSNGTNHPPVYIDDIEIKSLVSIADPLPTPYTVQFDGSRFTNVTMLTLPGAIGSVAVDPRDNSTILFGVDAAPGAIYKATKVAAGNWAVDPTPVVSGLDRPSGLTVAADGTLWWVHDYSMALMRLKAPWAANTPEKVIADFGVTPDTGVFTDDDPIDVCIAPASFNGSIGRPNMVVVVDRGTDGDANNALYVVDPATTELNQTNYNRYLVAPTASLLGAVNMEAVTALPKSGEIATLCVDGQITAVDANGSVRSFFPMIFADPYTPISPV